jgi:Flp pilus assembly CpaE family ATPase
MDERAIRLLIVEDNPADAKFATIMLQDSKAAAFCAETCDRLSDALERLDSGRFDALLLDLSLPDSRGLETFDRVHAAAPKLPIVVMSGLDDEKVALQALHRGAQDYLIKGQVNGFALSRSLIFAVERQRKTHATESAKKGKVLVFVGAKGGVGTTTAALNIAAAIAAAKRSVIAVELRPSFGTFAFHLAHTPAGGLSNLLVVAPERYDEAEVSPYLTEFPSGLRVLFGPQHVKEFREINPRQAEVLLNVLAGMAEYVVVDLPDAISEASQTAVRSSKFGALVIDNDPLSLACGKIVLEELRSAGASIPLLKIIVVRRSEALSGLRMNEVAPALDCPILGVITPAADLCVRAQKTGTPFVLLDPNSTASGTVSEMAKQLLAQDDLRAPNAVAA